MLNLAKLSSSFSEKSSRVWIRLALLLSVFLMFTAFGMNAVVLPATLKSLGIPAGYIGLSVSMELLASMLVTFVVSTWQKRLGAFGVTALFLSAYSLMVVGLSFTQSFLIWVGLVFVMGFSVFGALITLLSLYQQQLENHHRAFYSALMTVFVCAGLTLGPFIVRWIGAYDVRSFWVSAVFGILVVVPLFFVRRLLTINYRKPVKLLFFVLRAPQIFWAKFMQEFCVMSIFAFTVIYMMDQGYTAETAGLMLSAFTASAIADLGIGYYLDRWDKARVVRWAFALLGLLVLILMVYQRPFWAMIALFFFIGMSVGSVQIGATAWLNSRFPKHVLLSANAAFHLVSSLGGILGVIVAGLGMEVHSVLGLPLVMFVGVGIYFLGVFGLRIRV